MNIPTIHLLKTNAQETKNQFENTSIIAILLFELFESQFIYYIISTMRTYRELLS